jgi:hypothetical protein
MSAERRASLEPLGLPQRDPPPLGYFGETNRVVTSAARVNPSTAPEPHGSLTHQTETTSAERRALLEPLGLPQ